MEETPLPCFNRTRKTADLSPFKIVHSRVTTIIGLLACPRSQPADAPTADCGQQALGLVPAAAELVANVTSLLPVPTSVQRNLFDGVMSAATRYLLPGVAVAAHLLLLSATATATTATAAFLLCYLLLCLCLVRSLRDSSGGNVGAVHSGHCCIYCP